MIRSLFVCIFALFCSVIIESCILTNIPVLYVVPDFVLICSVYFSLLNGRTFGEITGFAGGLILDFVTGIPFGFNCLIRTIVGYVFGFFTETVILKGFIIPMTTVAIATILKAVLISLTSVFFPNINIYNPGLISQAFLFGFIINIILAPLSFKFLSFFNSSFMIKTTQDKVLDVQ